MQLPAEVDYRLKVIDVRKKSIVYHLKSKTWRQWRFGFTLIELLVVITIIGILITLTTVSFTNAQKKGRDSKRKQDLQSVKQALESYFQTNGKYPNPGTITPGNIKCNDGTTTELAWGNAFTCNSTYATLLPKDPTGTAPYYYSSAAPFLTYVLYAALENTNDPDLTSPPARCATAYTGPPAGLIGAGTYNYCIVNP